MVSWIALVKAGRYEMVKLDAFQCQDRSIFTFEPFRGHSFVNFEENVHRWSLRKTTEAITEKEKNDVHLLDGI